MICDSFILVFPFSLQKRILDAETCPPGSTSRERSGDRRLVSRINDCFSGWSGIRNHGLPRSGELRDWTGNLRNLQGFTIAPQVAQSPSSSKTRKRSDWSWGHLWYPKALYTRPQDPSTFSILLSPRHSNSRFYLKVGCWGGKGKVR